MKSIKLKNRIFLIFIVLFLGACAFCYARWIEPTWIKVSRYTLKAPVKNSFKVAHLSDLHIKALGYRENHLLALIKQEAPDAILISGDSISEGGDYKEVGNFLKKLTAPRGVWLVQGNWEHWRPNDHASQIYADSGVTFLNNSNYHLFDAIWIIGLDDSSAGNPNLALSLSGVPDTAYKIGIFHSPDYFLKHGTNFDLVLAGHTHGGQIRLPFLPPLWLPHGSGPYVEGWYDAQNNKSKMYVSRGIGNSILELRFFCRPELPIITIVPLD